MSLYQGQSVVATPRLLSGELYPIDVYRAADSKSLLCRVDSEKEESRSSSRAITNLIIEVLHTEIIQPLEQIPDIANRLSSGSLDSETLQKIRDVFAGRFPQFTNSLAEGKLGQLLNGDRQDLAQRVVNLLNNRSLLMCAGKPLLNILAACVFRTQVPQLAMPEITKFLGSCRAGSLVDAIGCRADALMDEVVHKEHLMLEASQQSLAASQQRLAAAQERDRAAQQRLAAAQQSLAASQQSLAASQQSLATSQQSLATSQQRLRVEQRELAESKRLVWAVKTVKEGLISHGILPRY